MSVQAVACQYASYYNPLKRLGLMALGPHWMLHLERWILINEYTLKWSVTVCFVLIFESRGHNLTRPWARVFFLFFFYSAVLWWASWCNGTTGFRFFVWLDVIFFFNLVINWLTNIIITFIKSLVILFSEAAVNCPLMWASSRWSDMRLCSCD